MAHTVADFWQMVWEQGSVVLVMLSRYHTWTSQDYCDAHNDHEYLHTLDGDRRLSENGYQLAHRYWPEEGSEQYHIFEVGGVVMLSVWSTSFRVNYGNSMVEINSTNFVWSLELPFLCVCRIFSINALNQYNPSLESRVGKNMFSLSLNSLSKQIVQNQSVITGSLSSILQPRSSPSSWWSNAGAPGVGARVVRRLSCAVPLSEEHPDRRDSHGVL